MIKAIINTNVTRETFAQFTPTPSTKYFTNPPDTTHLELGGLVESRLVLLDPAGATQRRQRGGLAHEREVLVDHSAEQEGRHVGAVDGAALAGQVGGDHTRGGAVAEAAGTHDAVPNSNVNELNQSQDTKIARKCASKG